MIEKIIIISLITIAFWSFFLPNMILGWIADYFEDKLPRWIKEPLWDCPICLCFWYGTPLYWIIWGSNSKEWLIVVFAAMGLNTVFVKMKKN